ncbi:MAG: TRAP transporter small permease subunit [Ectothiorhodospiraceae bacterium]|nr:TRAP transporter small permease subunit [Ectothiorhodospiraceae bacterium]MCH8502836.1 TRAP transporter small permease subunit [Ectothiorhodospiraceae bacterium]
MGLLAWVDRINIWIGKVVSYLIWFGIAIIVLEVLLRYVFNSPTVWGPGYTQRIFGSYFILIGAYTLIRGGHVRVDLLLNTRSPRWNALLDLLNYVVLVIWVAALTYEGWYYFEEAWMFNETDDSALRHPMWPVKLALFVGVLMIAIQGVVEIIRSAVLVVRPGIDVKRVDAA